MPPVESASERVPFEEVRDLLHVGHPLPFRVLDAQARLLLNAGQMLTGEAMFDGLVERGAWAELADVMAERARRDGDATRAAASAVPPPTLFDRWEKLLWQFDVLMRALVRHSVRREDVVAFHSKLSALVERDADVALFHCVRHDDQRFALYPLTHAIHCAVVTMLTGRKLGYSEAKVVSTACAALTMNVSILELQAVMAEQDTEPTSRQRAQIRAHPEASVQLLRAAGVDDLDWLATVAQHHERTDGKGYPFGQVEVCDTAHLLHAADVYMAKISPRAKRPPMAASQAGRQLFQERGGDVLAMSLVKSMGVHPPGSLVQLKSGEVAVVIRRPVKGPHPLVATLSDARGQPSSHTLRRDTAQAEFAIQGPVQHAHPFARVLPERVYGVIAG